MPSFEPIPATSVTLSSVAGTTTAPLTFRLITTDHELQMLAPAWQELHAQSAGCEPMRGPDWLLTWWQIYGQDRSRTLCVGLFCQGDQLVGVAPLCRRRFWHPPGIPLTRLEFLGADVDEQDGVCSEYLSLTVRAGYEGRVAQAFAREIARGSFGSWQEMLLSSMNGEETLTGQLQDALRAAGYGTQMRTTMEAPYLRLPASWDAYLKSLNASKRRYLTVSWREFESWAGNDWQVEHATSAETLAKGLAILHALHNHRWQEGSGIEGAFHRRRFAAFHQEYLLRLLRAGQLDLFWLNVRGEPIAVSYQFRTPHKVYLYQSGRKLDVPSAVRPGIVISILAIQEALAHGLSEYDFLGGASQYKLQFARTTRPLVQIRIARSCPSEWLRRGAEAAISSARKLRNTLRRWRQQRQATAP